MITTILLIAGASKTVLSGDNKTALTIAQETGNEGFLSAYEDFRRVRDDKLVLAKLSALREDLNKNYCFQVNTKTRGTVEHFQAKFTLPDFLFHDTARTGNIPDDMRIHEHQIRPLTRSGFDEMEGMEALNCLAFSFDQANINKHRRERLMELGDPSFKPVHLK